MPEGVIIHMQTIVAVPTATLSASLYTYVDCIRIGIENQAFAEWQIKVSQPEIEHKYPSASKALACNAGCL